MKALVKNRLSRSLDGRCPIPEPGINDVLIQVKRTAICGTDMHIYHWDAWAQKTIPVPMVIGHEFVGEIVEVGSNVIDFHPGQIVSGEGHVVCGRCRNCMAGRRRLCAYTSGIGSTGRGPSLNISPCPCPMCGSTPQVSTWTWLRCSILRQRGAHRAAMAAAGRGYIDHGRRPDRRHGGCGLPSSAGARNVVITDLIDARLALAATGEPTAR